MLRAEEHKIPEEFVGTPYEPFFNEFVSVTAVKDFDLDEGTKTILSGEIINLPRWKAEALENEEKCKIKLEDIEVQLKQAIVKEKVNEKICQLDKFFYFNIRRTLDKNPNETVDSLFLQLVRKRRGKIIPIADAVKISHEFNKSLTIEEMQLFESINKATENFENSIFKN